MNFWCVGRNYVDHAKEMGVEPPKEPLIFLKAGGCKVSPGSAISLPSWSNDVHHEIEVAIEINQEAKILRAAIALDLTARDLQAEAKKAGKPWTQAKSFKDSCPLGFFFDVKTPEDLDGLSFHLDVNGETRQKGNTKDMVFGFQELARWVCDHYPVQDGDIILTGTPAGVGPLKSGDEITAEIDGKTTATWKVK